MKYKEVEKWVDAIKAGRHIKREETAGQRTCSLTGCIKSNKMTTEKKRCYRDRTNKSYCSFMTTNDRYL